VRRIHVLQEYVQIPGRSRDRSRDRMGINEYLYVDMAIGVAIEGPYFRPGSSRGISVKKIGEVGP
jgi:hypothetical protein